MKRYLIFLLMAIAAAACAQNPHPPVKSTMDPANAEATTAAFLATRQAKTAVPTATLEPQVFVTLGNLQDGDISLWESAGEDTGQVLAQIPDQTVVEVLDIIVVGEGEIWYQVTFNGITGWVTADFVREETP